MPLYSICGRHAAPLAMLGLAIGVLAGPAAAQQPTPPTDLRQDSATGTSAPLAQARPRIGLVLGGGGAKGAAHVGVLSVLEELRIPVDCVVGTSMGALVGGIYASGVDAAALERAIGEIPWGEVLAFTSRREKQPMRRKLSGVIYSNTLSVGYKDGGVVTPRGFIETQNIEQTIRYLSQRGRSVTNFDDLAIPFRAIATDMRTGDMVVKGSGDLALAMRASMAVPGVFAPVEVDGQVLGDGGLVRNLAVDVARELCADVVIAVALPNPPPSTESLTSPVGLIGRTLDVLIGANEREQLRSLGPNDVAIVVPSTNMGAASFDLVTTAVPHGRAAALEARAALERLSLPEADYLAWRERTLRSTAEEIRLAAVEVRGLQRIDPRFVESNLPLKAGDTVTLAEVSAAMDSLYALDGFDAVEYRLLGDPDAPTLEITATEKELGATVLRVDLGLYADSDDNNAFIIGGDLRRTWVNRAGARVARSLPARPHDWPRGLVLPAAGRAPTVVRRAVAALRAVDRGHLRRRRGGGALRVWIRTRRAGRRLHVRQPCGTARGRAVRLAVGGAGHCANGFSRAECGRLRRALAALRLRFARPCRARHPRARSRGSSTSTARNRSVPRGTTTGSRAWWNARSRSTTT